MDRMDEMTSLEAPLAPWETRRGRYTPAAAPHDSCRVVTITLATIMAIFLLVFAPIATRGTPWAHWAALT